MMLYLLLLLPAAAALPNPSAAGLGLSNIHPPHVLLTENAPVETDVRGNLGPPEVITNPRKADWIKDRWQAASDMNGTPIPGPHWVKITLQGSHQNTRPTKIVLDWETAYAKGYAVETTGDGETWHTIYDSMAPDPFGQLSTSAEKQHVIHTIEFSPDVYLTLPDVIKQVRVSINTLGTAWGASLWEVQVWGLPLASSPG